ncbi:MAG: RNA polymerase sigma factor [Lachnospiraceae bacterium]|nr:RNA polymerase sigma factor [Lachnospiraceae bacterium]
MTNQDFDACIERIKNGDRSGLKEIYEAYLSYIFRIVFDVLKSRENAEDITSEFFIKLWEKAGSYRLGGGHRAFLTVMARNMAIDFLRKHRKEELTAMLQDLGAGADEVGNTPGTAVSAAMVETNPTEAAVIAEMTIQKALDLLGEAERQIIGMKVLGELTFREIAEVLKCPLGTVTWRYQNAIKKLRRCGFEHELS